MCMHISAHYTTYVPMCVICNIHNIYIYMYMYISLHPQLCNEHICIYNIHIYTIFVYIACLRCMARDPA